MAVGESAPRRVAIVQRVMPHYRIPFFESLAQRLGEEGIELSVLYGEERSGTVPRTTTVDAPWASRIHNRYITFGRYECVLQFVPASLYDADLVIVEQALRLPLNLWLQARRCFAKPQLAFWGHGRNFQAHGERGLSESIKHRLINAVDWWFAYTDLSRELVLAAGYPEERITSVNNSIDTSRLRDQLTSVDDETRERVRAQHGVGHGPVALYCGGMYADKRLPFLLDAVQRIREQVPGFEMVFIGDGPEAWRVRDMAQQLPWLHYLGPLFDADRAPWLSLSQVMLMPGLVGLAVLDAFVAGLPLVTTAIDYHSPEIAYLVDGENGVVTPDDVTSYADAVVQLLLDSDRRAALSASAMCASETYSIERMADRFAQGTISCLSMGRRS